MKKIMKKTAALFTAAAILVGLAGCAAAQPQKVSVDPVDAAESAVQTFKVGICNYVDDASLNQIVDNIESQLETLGKENNVKWV